MKRRQEAAEEAERQRLQAEQEARAAAEAQAEAARQASRDSHDAPGSPQREHQSGNLDIARSMELLSVIVPHVFNKINKHGHSKSLSGKYCISNGHLVEEILIEGSLIFSCCILNIWKLYNLWRYGYIFFKTRIAKFRLIYA